MIESGSYDILWSEENWDWFGVKKGCDVKDYLEVWRIIDVPLIGDLWNENGVGYLRY